LSHTTMTCPRRCRKRARRNSAASGAVKKAYVEAEPFVASRYSECSKSGDAVVTIVVAHDGCLAGDSPGPTAAWNEQKAALIEEGEVGAKSSPFFLAPATCAASSFRLPLRLAGLLSSPEPDSSSLTDAVASRGDQQRNGLRTPFESQAQSVSVSRCRWQIPKPLRPAAEYRRVADTDLDAASRGDQVRASGPVRSFHLLPASAAIYEPKRLKHQVVGQPPRDSNPSKAGKRPFAGDVPAAWGSHAVS
jgi:hypothetical protein